MKVIIAGAGIGGIYAGERLGELGFEVVVYEKAKSVKEMRFDWHDVVSPKIFRRLGLPIPSEHFKVLPYSFVTPYEKFIKRLPAGDPDPDISLERVPLNEMLYNHAKAYAKFEFGKTVTAPIVKDNRVVGVVVDGKEEYADFVLDSAGIYSPVRKNLPKEFNITEIKDEERFSAYRAFYNRADVPEPEHTNKAYLKHFGGKGLSWVLLDDDTSKVNVLIGRLDSLNDSEREELLADLKANNPIIGEGITRGGFTTLIPLRYPATRFVANGYAGIGDTAYMTIPMKGSGIASGLISAHLLWETLKEAMDKGENSPNIFNIETLWNYQVKCYMEFGAKHCAVDI
ncbi:MAG: NAD(P)/FAD-dependent oxidoreductase, partial [Firmicutes bacterium]|nr:NAD(P)/FAD-dependent oxidoreductase [Bacillota bacterium]